MGILIASGFSDSIELLKEYGPVIGPMLLIIAFFVWRDWKREDKLAQQVTNLQNEVRSILIPLVKECTEVVTRNTELCARNYLVLERVERRLDE